MVIKIYLSYACSWSRSSPSLTYQLHLYLSHSLNRFLQFSMCKVLDVRSVRLFICCICERGCYQLRSTAHDSRNLSKHPLSETFSSKLEKKFFRKIKQKYYQFSQLFVNFFNLKKFSSKNFSLRQNSTVGSLVRDVIF